MFNIVRVALLEAYGPKIYSCAGSQYNPGVAMPYHIIKTHPYSYRWRRDAKAIFTSRRDLRDIAASAVRVGKVQNTLESIMPFIKQAVWEHGQWYHWSNLEIEYEFVCESKQTRLWSTAIIIRELGLDVDPQVVATKVDSFMAPPRDAETYDPDTLLTPGHITDGRVGSYGEVLSAEVVETIEREYVNWLRSYCYGL